MKNFENSTNFHLLRRKSGRFPKWILIENKEESNRLFPVYVVR